MRCLTTVFAAQGRREMLPLSKQVAKSKESPMDLLLLFEEIYGLNPELSDLITKRLAVDHITQHHETERS